MSSGADKIKLEYPKAEEMRKTFQAGVQQLEETMQEMQSIANTLKEGALLGKAGAKFVDSIHSKFAPSLAKLTDKYHELDDDVAKAIKFMKDADKQAAGMYGGK